MTRKRRVLTLDQPVVAASEYETPMECDDLQEEFPEPEPEIVIPKVIAPVIKRVVDEKDIKVAIPIAVAEGLETARATKTCKKFVGKWINLRAGKTITDAKEVIAHLRIHDLVE